MQCLWVPTSTHGDTEPPYPENKDSIIRAFGTKHRSQQADTVGTGTAAVSRPWPNAGQQWLPSTSQNRREDANGELRLESLALNFVVGG